MKKVLLSAVLSTLPVTVAYANNGHHHEGHEHSAKGYGRHGESMSEHHNQMMNKHQGGDGAHHAGGHHGMGHGDSLAGKPGKVSEVDRIIKVEANDAMRFIHEPIKVKAGETIKFEITNRGAIPHEFSIGTKDEHMVHGKMMMENPGMHHSPGGSSITIAPGETESLIWYFEEAKEMQAACNISGHYQAGMHSDIEFGN